MAWNFEKKEEKKESKEIKLIEDLDKLKATFHEQCRMVAKDRETSDNILVPLVFDLFGAVEDDTQLGMVGDLRHKLRGSRIGEMPLGIEMKTAINLMENISREQTRYYEQLEKYIEGFNHMIESSFAIIKNVELQKEKLQSYLGDKENLNVKPRRTAEETRDLVMNLLSQGISQIQIARDLGLAASWVSEINKKYYEKRTDVVEETTESVDTPLSIKKNESNKQVFSPVAQNSNSEKPLNNEEKEETDENEDENNE